MRMVMCIYETWHMCMTECVHVLVGVKKDCFPLLFLRFKDALWLLPWEHIPLPALSPVTVSAMVVYAIWPLLTFRLAETCSW